MTSKSANRTPLRMILAFGLLATTAGFTAAPAFAGDCPADQVGVDVTKPGPSMPKDVTDEVISSIDLSSKGDALEGHHVPLPQAGRAARRHRAVA